jgi:hypothetical protein
MPAPRPPRDSPRRFDAAKKLLADMGGEMKQFYMVMRICSRSEAILSFSRADLAAAISPS